EFKLTPWYRKGYDVFAATQSPVIVNGKPLTSPSGAVVFNPPVQSNQGYSRAVGTELNVTHLVPFGLSWQFNATYQNEFSSVIPLSASEDFFPTLPPASLALGNVYRVGYLSPFQFTFALSDKLKDGLRINPIYRYDVGYPYNAGNIAAAFVNGVAYNLPNTNVLQGIVSGSAQGSTSSYVDPINPGSLFNPNIAATRGTPESASPGGKLTHPEAFIDLNLEYSRPDSRVTYGLQVNNLFDEVYGGTALAPYYQPVATGIGGPLTGIDNGGLGYTQGAYGYANRGSNRYGTYPYNNTPGGIGRSYYFYVTFKV
ncbi:MAG TPA: hypothetical protein VFN49_07210, partial [Candidatus Aquilonibacter sp.]|nr:hypothetical protein [Candidatus Aquilonibacter sp.]